MSQYKEISNPELLQRKEYIDKQIDIVRMETNAKLVELEKLCKEGLSICEELKQREDVSDPK